MPRAPPPPADSYELTQSPFSSTDNDRISSEFDDVGARANLLTEENVSRRQPGSLVTRLARLLPFGKKTRTTRSRQKLKRRRGCVKPSGLRRLLFAIVFASLSILLVAAIFFPSYTHPPARYVELRRRVQSEDKPGVGNIASQRVFIAASIFDKKGDLAGGHWGESLIRLIRLLGPDNVYLSIYENDAGPVAEAALDELRKKVLCEHTLRFEQYLNIDEIKHVILPDGSTRVKRLDYLAEVRNRALAPLMDAYVRYDKVLYLNDVVFDPVDALQLLFSTHASPDGHAEYRAACAVDFINPFKYYDTFATRDVEGYGIGLPFFPWFTTAGRSVSRDDVLGGNDAVRVKSCWGGMVAFDARYLQPQQNSANVPVTAAGESPSNITHPYRFRAEEDLYWDASECCLIHADIQDPDREYSGIFMNPYVRVAYDSRTLSWLSFTRRFERAYAPFHWLLSKVVGMPWYNPRRAELPFEEVVERVWVPGITLSEGGSFQMVKRSATHSGFCGRRALQVLKLDITKAGKNWEFMPVPS